MRLRLRSTSSPAHRAAALIRVRTRDSTHKALVRSTLRATLRVCSPASGLVEIRVRLIEARLNPTARRAPIAPRPFSQADLVGTRLHRHPVRIVRRRDTARISEILSAHRGQATVTPNASRKRGNSTTAVTRLRLISSTEVPANTGRPHRRRGQATPIHIRVLRLI